jgi:hypothetical protein
LTSNLQARFEGLLKEFSGTRDEVQQVVDNVLNCFCQGASSDINKNGRVTSWAATFCRSLVDSATDVMWEELLLRLQELLGEKTTELEVLHVTCLALFSMLLASFSISDRKETISSSSSAKKPSCSSFASSSLKSTSGLQFVSTILLGTEILVFRSWERSGAIFRFCAEYLRWSLGSARNVSFSDASSKEQFTVPVNNPSTSSSSSTCPSAFQIELAILPTRLLHLLKWFHDRCNLLKRCESFCGVIQGTRNVEHFGFLQELLQSYERLFGNSLVNSILFKNSASFSLEDWMTLEASISREEDFFPLHIRREYTRKQLIQYLDSLQDVSVQPPEELLPSFCKSLLRSLFSSTIQLQRTVKDKKEAERRGLGFDPVFLELFQEFIADHLCTETALTLEPPSGWLLSICEELLYTKTSRKETLLGKHSPFLSSPFPLRDPLLLILSLLHLS